MYTYKMSSKLSESFTCIFHRFLPMFAVKMSHSGGILNFFFDFDPLPKLKHYESLHLPELIGTHHCSRTDHMATNYPYNVNHKPCVKNEGEIEEYEGEYDKMRVRGWVWQNEGASLLMRVSWKVWLSINRSMKKKDNGQVHRLWWQDQEDFFCVPSCSSVLYIQKHPFTSTQICNVVEIDSIECDSAIQKPLCERHYQLVYYFIYPSKIDR